MKRMSFRYPITFLIFGLLLTGCFAPKRGNPLPTETALPPTPTRSLTYTPKPRFSPTPIPSPTTDPSPTLSPSKSPTPDRVNPHVVVGVEENDVLHIRESAGIDHKITGIIPPSGFYIEITGEEVKLNNSTWVPIKYEDEEGWVNKHYLAKQIGNPDPEIYSKSNQIVLALKNKDFSTLSRFVHPQKCLRFSPYPTIKPEHQVFCPSEIKNLPSNNTQYLWGQYDGSGKPIELSFSQYYEQFIYDVNFAHAEMIGFNHSIGTGNAINNIQKVFPQASFVEYHFPGFDPQYDGMDWKSLRLVFEQHNQEWLLVAVIHGEWTI